MSDASSLPTLAALVVEAGAVAERQERGLIRAINKIASPQNPVTVRTRNQTVRQVVHATKVPGLSALGKEPYTDVQLVTASGRTINISAKGSSAPSLAGGGLVALDILVPDLVEHFLKSALRALKKHGYKAGQQGVPDVYGMIPDGDVTQILRGNKDMGGPIDYMYQGPMDVVAEYPGNNTVVLNGALTSIKQYAKLHKLYLRARKRREDQPFDPKAVDSSGMPSLFGRSPSKGDSNRRIVITDKVPNNGLIVKL